MQQLQLADVSLAYELRGEGTPAVLLHGFTQRGDAWQTLLDHLGSGHRWITFDLRGHGRTQTAAGTPFSFDACIADVVALLDRLDAPRAHVVGYSMGGRLALHLAVTRPERVRSLTVISAHAGLNGDERAQRRDADEQLARRIERDGIAWFAPHWAALPMLASLRERNPAVAQALLESRLQSDAHGLAASLRGMGAGAMQPLWDALGSVRCPVLLMAGEDDPRYVAYAQRMQASLPDARLEVIPAAGHAAHLERPDAVAALIARFLAGVDGAPGS